MALGLADASLLPMSSTVPLTRALACGRRLGRSKVTGENIRLILSLGEEIDTPDGDAPIMRFAYECECECGKGKGREGKGGSEVLNRSIDQQRHGFRTISNKMLAIFKIECESGFAARRSMYSSKRSRLG